MKRAEPPSRSPPSGVSQVADEVSSQQQLAADSSPAQPLVGTTDRLDAPLPKHPPERPRPTPQPPPPPRTILVSTARTNVQESPIALHLSQALPGHRLVRTEASRALEGPLARVAAEHPAAIAAVANLCSQIQRFISATNPDHPPFREIFGSFDLSTSNHIRNSQMGDVHPTEVENVLDGGNIREQLTMVANARFYLHGAMHKAASSITDNPAYRSELEATVALDSTAIIARFLTAGRRDPQTFLDPRFDETTFQQQAMRMMRSSAQGNSTQAAVYGVRRFTNKKIIPPLSQREIAHAAAADSSASAGGPPGKDMPHRDGKTLYLPRGSHDWHQDAWSRGMHTAVSISGTSYRAFLLHRLLGGSPTHDEGMTLALLGTVMGPHHTYHEVMAALADVGVPHVASPERMIEFAKHILASHPPAANRPQRDALDELQKVINETQKFLGEAL